MKQTIVLFIGLLFFSLNVCGQEVNKIIVKVNNQVITSRDLDEYCKVLAYRFFNKGEEISVEDKEFRGNALDGLIEDILVLEFVQILVMSFYYLIPNGSPPSLLAQSEPNLDAKDLSIASRAALEVDIGSEEPGNIPV